MKKQEENNNEKPYESIDEWLNEIRHLKWPFIIIVIFILTLLLFFQLNVL